MLQDSGTINIEPTSDTFLAYQGVDVTIGIKATNPFYSEKENFNATFVVYITDLIAAQC